MKLNISKENIVHHPDVKFRKIKKQTPSEDYKKKDSLKNHRNRYNRLLHFRKFETECPEVETKSFIIKLPPIETPTPRKKDFASNSQNDSSAKKLITIESGCFPKIGSSIEKRVINIKKLYLEKFKKQKIKRVTVPLTLLETPPLYYDSLEEISQFHNYKETFFPFYSNIKVSQIQTFNYTINKVYREQLTKYFSHRVNWNLVFPKIDKGVTVNFQWKYLISKANFAKCKYDPSSQNIQKKKLRMVNLFERNYELGNKKNLFINLIKYCDSLNINVFSIIPFTIVFSNNKNFDIAADAFYDIYAFLNQQCKNKSDKIFANKLYSSHFDFDSNYASLSKTYINFPNSFISDKNYWIIKPVNLYQGKCIEISGDFADIISKTKQLFKGVDKTKLFPKTENNNNSSLINSNEDCEENEDLQTQEMSPSDEGKKKKKNYTKMYCSNDVILQKYLDKPLLYQKRKFDIRCYVLVDHNLNVYYCREGHLKSSSEEYSLENTNKFVHITNHCLQKKSENFAKYEYGNEMSYNDFKNVLQNSGISLTKFENMLLRIKYLIDVSMNSVGKRLFKKENVLSFEIFGYDFIVDENFTPYILEINCNPGLGISSPVIEKLVPRMVDDAFRLTIDKVFETKYDPSVIDPEKNIYQSKYKLDGFTDEENVFEFVCNINK